MDSALVEQFTHAQGHCTSFISDFDTCSQLR